MKCFCPEALNEGTKNNDFEFFFRYNIVFPCMMMSTLTVLVFCLPPGMLINQKVGASCHFPAPLDYPDLDYFLVVLTGSGLNNQPIPPEPVKKIRVSVGV